MQSSEPGTDHASAAESLFDKQEDSTGAEDLDELDDGRSDTSKACDGLDDTGGDDKSHSSDGDYEDDEVSTVCFVSVWLRWYAHHVL